MAIPNKRPPLSGRGGANPPLKAKAFDDALSNYSKDPSSSSKWLALMALAIDAGLTVADVFLILKHKK